MTGKLPFSFCEWRTTHLSTVQTKLSSIVKPLSARIRSPGRRLLRIPQCSVIYLSDAQPPQALDKNDIVPCGVMATNTLIVLRCLYSLHV